LLATGWTTCVQLPTVAGTFPFADNVRTGSGSKLVHPLVPGVLSPEVKRPILTLTARLRVVLRLRMRGALPSRLHGTVLKHKDRFTFTLLGVLSDNELHSNVPPRGKG
jgi:hypothetical protein